LPELKIKEPFLTKGSFICYTRPNITLTTVQLSRDIA
jgi:hypothetical protein